MQDLLIRAATVVAVALAAFSSFPSPAQKGSQTPTQPQAAASSQAQPEQQQTEQQPNVRTVQLQLITGELVDKLDSKSAKQGDSVILKTREEVKTPDGTDIPKGSKLVGHVTNVQPRSGDKENSQITLQFDRAELKTGQTLPIASVIESVAPSTGGSTAENNSPMAPASPGAMDAPANGSVPAAGSMSGSGASPTNNNGVNRNSTNTQPGMAVRPTAQTPAQSNGAPAAGSIVARNGNVAIRATSIPGVLLANNINGQPFSNASGVLLGARRDVSLDGGTQMVVGVATTPGSGMSR